MEDVATFEDLSIDDTLNIVERVRKYSTSTIALQRLVHVKMLTEAAAAAGYEETCATIIPILKVLAADSEWVVRQHLGEQLGGVSEYCVLNGGEPGYRLILETMLPLLAKLLGDRQEEVRLSTGVSLCRLSKLMRVEDRGKHVLTIILQLAHDDEQEELRMTAAKLLNDIVESLGPDLCHQFVSPEIVSLAEDPVFRVRKAAALNMHTVCLVGGDQDTTDRLLPAYIRLTKDDIYRVRKACAESLVDISKSVNSDLRSHILVEVFLRLSTDNSKFVRHSALQQLGPFIATLRPEEVTPDLLKLFVSMASPSSGDAAVDNEIRLYCAYSLPGVVSTVGPQAWDDVREAFQLLVRDVQWNIRRTLAFSLHELARVLQDPARVEAELLFAFDLFLRDVDDVRTGALQNVSTFLAHLTPPTRESYLQSLCEMISRTTPTNWRPREVLAGQLPELIALFSEESAQHVLSPLCFALLEDPVSAVRDRAIPSFAPLVERFGEAHADWRGAVLARLLALADSDTYTRRQLFLHIAGRLASGSMPRPLFLIEVLPRLLPMAADPVPNIRIALAADVGQYPAWLLEQHAAKPLLIQLLTDENKDVQCLMSSFRQDRPEIMDLIAGDLPPPPTPLPPPPPVVSMMQQDKEEDEDEGRLVVEGGRVEEEEQQQQQQQGEKEDDTAPMQSPTLMPPPPPQPPAVQVDCVMSIPPAIKLLDEAAMMNTSSDSGSHSSGSSSDSGSEEGARVQEEGGMVTDGNGGGQVQQLSPNSDSMPSPTAGPPSPSGMDVDVEEEEEGGGER